jgi:hypothetical protein
MSPAGLNALKRSCYSKIKCPLKKTQSFCPCSRALNRSSKGLNYLSLKRFSIVILTRNKILISEATNNYTNFERQTAKWGITGSPQR